VYLLYEIYVQITRSFANWTGHTKEIVGFKERGFKYQTLEKINLRMKMTITTTTMMIITI